MKANYGELALQLRTVKSAFGDGFAEARVRYGLQGNDLGTFVDLREAYVNAYVGPVDLRLGKQIIVWGRADALNPTNNLTPVDFRIRSPLEDDIRLGNVGARAPAHGAGAPGRRGCRPICHRAAARRCPVVCSARRCFPRICATVLSLAATLNSAFEASVPTCAATPPARPGIADL
jgi:hypothetical protein